MYQVYEWIKIEDNLPTEDGWYLCTTNDDRVVRLYFYTKTRKWIENIKKHMFDIYDIFGHSSGRRILPKDEDCDWTDKVIAWMPLPEPYKESE